MQKKTKFNSIKAHDDLEIRAGCKDVWNAFMLEGAIFTPHDIPYCPTICNELPKEMYTWEEAVSIHRQKIKAGELDYFINAYINWYIDDYKFDSPRVRTVNNTINKYNCIWNYYDCAWKVIKHFAGIITPDYSTNQDFPEPQKTFSTYKMRAFGYWIGKQGKQVINNVRWGTEETFEYCFNGIPINSIVSIGTVGGGPRNLKHRKNFEVGFYKMIDVLKPKVIIVYGSANAECFDYARKQGILIVSFKSRTAKFYEGRK